MKKVLKPLFLLGISVLLVLLPLPVSKLKALDLPLSTTSNTDVRITTAYTLDEAVATGDLNGDTFDDIAFATQVGSNYYVNVIFGKPGYTSSFTLDNTSNFNVRIATTQTFFSGIKIVDINGDETKDLVLSSFNYNAGGRTTNGAIFGFFGQRFASLGSTTGNELDLATQYNFMIYGASNSDSLTAQDVPVVKDLNGDGDEDLVFNGGNNIYVLYSGLINTLVSNNIGISIDLANASSYNIRYTGTTLIGYGAFIPNILVEDINGDGLTDLVFSDDTDVPSGGFIWVIYSALITASGGSTGNNKDLSTSTNYSIRYDGVTASANQSIGRGIYAGDINGDGDSDLVYTYGTTKLMRIIFSTHLATIPGPGTNLEASTAGNYNLQLNFTGSDAMDDGIVISDFNQDGFSDLVISGNQADNGGSNSGSVWVLFSTLIDNYNTTGNNLTMSTSTNYNARYDTNFAGAGLILTNQDIEAFSDFNSDGDNDLVLGAGFIDNNGTSNGSLYYINSSELASLGTTTGNILDLTDSNNYTLRIDGESDFDGLGSWGYYPYDYNADGKKDILVSSYSSIDNDYVTYAILQGTKVSSIGSSLGAVLTSSQTNVLINKTSGTKNVQIKDGSIVLADVDVTFPDGFANTSFDWSTVTGDTDTTNGKSFIYNLVPVDGTAATFDLYIPIPLGNTGTSVRICPSANSLASVTDNCAGGVDFIENATHNVNGVSVTVTKTTISSQDYWLASGVNGTGGMILAAAANNNPAVSNLGGATLVNGSTSANNQPTFSFDIADTDGDNVRFRIQIDDNSDFSSPAIDYSSSFGGLGGKTFTVGQAAGSGTYTAGSSGQTLSNASYYWRVMAEDDNAGASSYSVANSGGVAFVINVPASGGGNNNNNNNQNNNSNNNNVGNSGEDVILTTTSGELEDTPVSAPVSYVQTGTTNKPTTTSSTEKSNSTSNTNSVGFLGIDLNNPQVKGTASDLSNAFAGALALGYTALSASLITFVGLNSPASLNVSTFSNIFRAIGIIPIKRRKGYVYQTKTSKPVAFATLRIRSEGTNSILGTLVTDLKGAYYEPFLAKGSYYLEVLHNEYSFPTKLERPAYLGVADFYKKEVLNVSSDKSEQSIVIPMDSNLGVQGNAPASFNRILARVLELMSNLVVVFFLISLYLMVTGPNLINIVVTIFYSILVYKQLSEWFKRPSLRGKVLDIRTRLPIEGVFITLKDKNGNLIGIEKTNANGEYKFYAPQDKYSLYFSKEGYMSNAGFGESEIIDLNNVSLKNIGLSKI